MSINSHQSQSFIQHVLVVTSVGDDGIIKNTSILLADQGELSKSGLQSLNVGDQNSLEELNTVLTGPPTSLESIPTILT